MGHANISIFVPHLGCPRQCSFCEQNTITGRRQAPPPGQADVLAAAELAARSLDDADRAQAEIAFFGGSFTAIDRAYMLNLLAAFRRDIGPLDRIGSFVKMLALVASEDDFYDQPDVANGATDLLAEIFGEEAGLPARSAIGVNVLPGNIPVEIEVLIELKAILY